MLPYLIIADKKYQLDVAFCILSLLIVAQHVSGNCAHHQELTTA